MENKKPRAVAQFEKVSDSNIEMMLTDEKIKELMNSTKTGNKISLEKTKQILSFNFEDAMSKKELDDYVVEKTKEFDNDVKEGYKNLKLPKRSTMQSAGYDFFAPFDFTLQPGESINFPTGVRCKMESDVVLMLYPRSGLGFKYRCQLDNTVGVIDADYYYSDNEGHIGVKLTNDGNKTFTVEKGQGYMQGVFMPYFITYDDDADGIRNGGFGSTTK